MKVRRIDRAVWGKIQAALFTFGRFCDIIKVIRKLIVKLEFDEGVNNAYLSKHKEYPPNY